MDIRKPNKAEAFKSTIKAIPIENLICLKPQTKTILKHLSRFGSISVAEAITVYSIYRLAPAIHDLRNIGIKIETKLKSDAKGHRYARYEVAA